MHGFTVSIISIVLALSGYLESDADRAWKAISAPSVGLSGEADRVASYRQREESNRQMRERGLDFWRRFPDDVRRYEWLVSTNAAQVGYWQDAEAGARLQAQDRYLPVPVDEAAFSAWRMAYASMRAEFMAAPAVTDAQRLSLIMNELRWGMHRSRNAPYRFNKPFDLDDFLAKIDEYLAIQARGESQGGGFGITYPISSMYNYTGSLGLDVEAMQRFTERLMVHPNEEVQAWAARKNSIFAWRKTPMELSMSDVYGRPFDMKDYRGKIVLINFWPSG